MPLNLRFKQKKVIILKVATVRSLVASKSIVNVTKVEYLVQISVFVRVAKIVILIRRMP